MDDISIAINDDMYFSQQRNQLNRKSFYVNQIVNHIERFRHEEDSDINLSPLNFKIFIEANNE